VSCGTIHADVADAGLQPRRVGAVELDLTLIAGAKQPRSVRSGIAPAMPAVLRVPARMIGVRQQLLDARARAAPADLDPLGLAAR
jgi:hypothetical protein